MCSKQTNRIVKLTEAITTSKYIHIAYISTGINAILFQIWHSECSQPLVYSILSCVRTRMNKNSLIYDLVEGLATDDFTLHLRVHDHTSWFWRCVGMAFGHFLLGSHNFMVKALGSCVKWPLAYYLCIFSDTRKSMSSLRLQSRYATWSGDIMY